VLNRKETLYIKLLIFISKSHLTQNVINADLMSASEKVIPLHNEMQKKMERIQNGQNLGAVPQDRFLV
jgi:hypothetical protein